MKHRACTRNTTKVEWFLLLQYECTRIQYVLNSVITEFIVVKSFWCITFSSDHKILREITVSTKFSCKGTP
uniref:Uncharacterized protein n=1 Tax=Pararge aegeria TaxID=116150 RepID=S4NKD9_9NEOP